MSKGKINEKPTTKSSIDDLLKSKEKAIVLFYATWCPHSQRFLPIFQEYAKDKGEVEKRLDATPGVGLTKKQLKDLAATS